MNVFAVNAAHAVNANRVNANPKSKIVEIDKLKEHEKVFKYHYEDLKKEIVSDGVLKKAIAVDENTNIILDGHHRAKVLKELGFTRILSV